MFNAAAFKKMKRTAVFINSARGPLHVQVDLCQALKYGDIFAAGLNVTDPEPPAPDDPLLELPNVVVVPHIASGTVSSRNGMAEIFADNLLLGLSGQPLRAWVNRPRNMGPWQLSIANQEPIIEKCQFEPASV